MCMWVTISDIPVEPGCPGRVGSAGCHPDAAQYARGGRHGKLTAFCSSPRAGAWPPLLLQWPSASIQSRTVIYVTGMSFRAMHPPVAAAVAAIGVLQLVFAVLSLVFAYTYRYHSAFRCASLWRTATLPSWSLKALLLYSECLALVCITQ